MYDTSLNLSVYLQDCPPRHIQPGPALQFLVLSESHLYLLAPSSGTAISTAREAHQCLQSLHVEKSLSLPAERQFIHCEWVNKDCVLVTGRESTWIGQWSNEQWIRVGGAMCCSACVDDEKSMVAEPFAGSSTSRSALPSSSQEMEDEPSSASTVLLESSSGSLYLLRTSGCDGRCSALSA